MDDPRPNAERQSEPLPHPLRQDTVEGESARATQARTADMTDTMPPADFGRYRIVRKLGAGGMGAVYLARDTQLERDVALKVPNFAAQDRQQLVTRFYREARAAATLNHPNICPIYDVGEIQGMPYLTMAYIEGGKLSDFIRHDKPMPERQAVLLIRKLASALAEAHRKGIVHRDLKPSNVMIDGRQEPIVTDFGLARRGGDESSQLTHPGALLGTPAYMSPEQVLGRTEEIGPQCDVYSLGAMLYQLLSGRLPFSGPPMAVAGQILTSEPHALEEHRPDVSPELAAICRRAMAKKRETRFTDMTELATALTGFLERAKAAPETNAPTSELTNRPTAEPPALHEHPLAQLASLAAQRSRTRPVGAKAAHWAVSSDWQKFGVAAGVAGFCFLVLLGIVLRLQTKDGTLVVELFDPNCVVQVLDGKGRIEIERPGEPKITIAVAPGEHRLRLMQAGTEVFAQDFHIASGGQKVVSAHWLPASEQTHGYLKIELTCDRAKAMVIIDGNEFLAKELTEAIPLPPGEHTLLLRLDGREVDNRRISILEGKRQVVMMGDANVEVAQWVLSQGGSIEIAEVPGAIRELNALPLESYTVTTVSFDSGEIMRQLTDDDLGNLAGLGDLKTLFVSGTAISGTGFEHLRNNLSLRTLFGSGLRLTHEGYMSLSRLTQLEFLRLDFANLADQDLEHIAAIDNLKILDVNVTGINDSGLVFLKRLEKLESLDLSRLPGVTDAGLEHLKGMTRLRTLRLYSTSVTDSGVSSLQKALPDCEIQK